MLAFAGVALASAAVAGAAMWWYGPVPGANPLAAAEAEQLVDVDENKEPARYVTLDKVIVMLKRNTGDTQAHYISTDLVLSTTEENEKKAKEHLPMLRTVAVRALSSYALNEASAMTVEQFAERLNSAFEATYAAEKTEKPFSQVMIGKLIIE
ncbi:flagellar basal body-associated FliL family protein [Massilia sp. GCM10020059]|uniref:Flagellar protein FliL n=1 Tax=Massilia agrisoli TaxID=2892444 RepID=A0ABS8IP34_9BURK|nr:flagellar basal body-associated FliL family protein [Massilia agrisoli]MCC6069938.1 flagellar basal body-associated FliL family protein [Massilia agrisoli]